MNSPPAAEAQIAAVEPDKLGPSQTPRNARPIEAQPAAAPPVAADAHASASSIEARPEHSTMKAAADRAAQPIAALPRLSATALALMVWSIVVLLLLARLVRTELRFRSRFRLLAQFDPSRLAIDLDRLRRLAGVTQKIRVVECDDITSPAVCGIVRPTIILPRAIASSLTASQLRWVLLHELAHVRRRDLLVVVFQRLAAILHFFNPAVWIANHLIHRLREYACDDAALSLCDTSAVDSGEAFLTILRHAADSHRGLDGALGVFGLDSRASLFLRIGRLLDCDRPIRTRLGAWSFCGLALLAAIALPNLRRHRNGCRSAGRRFRENSRHNCRRSRCRRRAFLRIARRGSGWKAGAPGDGRAAHRRPADARTNCARQVRSPGHVRTVRDRGRRGVPDHEVSRDAQDAQREHRYARLCTLLGTVVARK